MSNMAYCRFRNTLHDLEDCLEALQSGDPVSREEREAAKELILIAAKVAECGAPLLDDEGD